MEGEKQVQEYRAPKTVKMFFSNVYKSYANKNPQKLSKLLKELYVQKLYDKVTLQSWTLNIKTITSEYTSFRDPLTAHFVQILDYIKNHQLNKKAKQWQVAFDFHMKIVIECLKLVEQIKDGSNKDEMWILKPVRTLLHSTKRVFFESIKHSASSSKLKNDLINTLNRFKSTRSLIEQVRVQILPLIDNMLVSILFTFHNYDNIRMIMYTSKLNLHSDNKFRDNYLFLRGKYQLVNENIKQAEKFFEMIRIRTRGQKRLVLKYLIPCKIFLGKMFQGRKQNQDQYFPEYQTLIKSLKNASFKQFDQTVQKYQKVWIKRGIYLLMDRLRILIWRNLIKRVYVVLGDKIMMEKIEKAVRLAGGEEDINECICIIGNLIYQGYVKGFIFQNNDIKGLVLKKKDNPFPKLSQIAS